MPQSDQCVGRTVAHLLATLVCTRGRALPLALLARKPCVIDIEGKTKAYYFALKHDQKGLVAQIYWPKPSKTTQ